MRAHLRVLAPTLFAAVLAGCAPRHDPHLARISELESENARLARENEALRARYEGSVVQATPIETRCAKKGAGYRITPSGLDELLKNGAGLKLETKPRVWFEGGRSGGLKISVTPGSLSASCGCEDGDIISKVNGFDATPAKWPQIEADLRKAKQVQLDIVRGGTPKTLVIDVVQP